MTNTHLTDDDTNCDFKLGEWFVSPKNLTISKAESQHKLTHTLMNLLLLLVKSKGEVVSRELIMHSIWPDTVVTDESISRCIADLRKALGDSARDPRYIQTISKKGYCLLVQAEILSQNNTTAKSVAPTIFKNKATLWGLLLIIALVLSYFYIASSENNQATQTKRFTKVKLALSGDNNRRPRIDPTKRFVVLEKNTSVNQSLWIFDLAKNSEKPLLASLDQNLGKAAISNNGNVLAFLEEDPKAQTCKIQLYTFKTSSKEYFQDCNAYRIGALDWTFDNNYLISTIRKPEQRTAGFAIHNIKNNQLGQSAFPKEALTGYLFPRVSPSGKKIAFVKIDYSSFIYSLGIFETDSGKITYLPTNSSKIQQVEWGGQDDTLYYADVGHAYSGLWEYNLDTQEESLVINESIIDFDISADTKLIVASVFEQNVGMYAKTEQNTEIKDITENKVNKPLVSLSGDGNYLAYVSDKGGINNIWLENLKTKKIDKLTNDVLLRYLSMSFSNDNRYLSYITVDAQNKRTAVIIDLLSPKQVYKLLNDAYSISWSKNQNDKLYAYSDSANPHIYSLSLTSNTLKKELDTPPLFRIELTSSDKIIVQKKIGDGLYSVDSNIGSNSNFEAESSYIDIPLDQRWGVSGDYITSQHQDNNGNATIDFYSEQGLINEDLRVSLKNTFGLISYTFSDDLSYFYYTNIYSQKHILFKFEEIE
jgi:DNA-binding winged helix-turn-helix (wHTH) protein